MGQLVAFEKQLEENQMCSNLLNIKDFLPTCEQVRSLTSCIWNENIKDIHSVDIIVLLQ